MAPLQSQGCTATSMTCRKIQVLRGSCTMPLHAQLAPCWLLSKSRPAKQPGNHVRHVHFQMTRKTADKQTMLPKPLGTCSKVLVLRGSCSMPLHAQLALCWLLFESRQTTHWSSAHASTMKPSSNPPQCPRYERPGCSDIACSSTRCMTC